MDKPMIDGDPQIIPCAGDAGGEPSILLAITDMPSQATAAGTLPQHSSRWWIIN
jgi:hypothetical protein